MNELTSALLDQAERDGLIVVVQRRDNSDSDDWTEISYADPSELNAQNALYGWAKYRAIARKPNDDEIADSIGEQFAEAADEF